MVAGTLTAQTPMKGFSSGGAISDGIDAVLAYPMADVTASTSLSVTAGLPFSELEVEEFEIEYPVTSDFTYTTVSGEVITIPASELTGGTLTRYYVGKGLHKYDLLLKLKGDPCGETTSVDLDGVTYNTVSLVGYCWTKENLRAATGIEEAMAYDEDETNAETYGRLYTWYSAVGVAEDGSETPAADENGYVQGICPDGWHIPTETEMQALQTVSSFDLNATTLWEGPYASQYTDAYGFTALPAGMYNSALTRYEGLGTQTDWWSVKTPTTSGSTVMATSYSSLYSCDELIEKNRPATDGLSVRCVKDM